MRFRNLIPTEVKFIHSFKDLSGLSRDSICCLQVPTIVTAFVIA